MRTIDLYDPSAARAVTHPPDISEIRAVSRFFPPRPFAPTLLLRATVLWIFLHGAMAVGSTRMGVPFPRALLGTPLTALWLTAAIVGATWFEMWRHGELTFLANLGYSFGRLALIVVAECLLLEVGLRVSFG